MALNPSLVVEQALANMKAAGLMQPGSADRPVYAAGSEPDGIPAGITYEGLERLKILAIVRALFDHMRLEMEVAGVANGGASASQQPPLPPAGPVPTSPPAAAPVFAPSQGLPLPPQPVVARVR